MATFQLAGLPSQVIANQNAPVAPATPAYDFSPRQNNVSQALQGLGQVAGVIGQAQQQERLQQFQQAFGQAYAAGDRDALKKLAATNPDQIEAIRKGMGFIDADRNQAIGDASAELRLAATQGPDAVVKALQKNAGTLQNIGVSPEGAWNTYQQNPQGFMQTADMIGLHALGPDKYFDVQDKMAGRDIQRGQLAETERSNRASESNTIRGQDIQIRGQNISASNSAADRDLKRLFLQQQIISNQLGQAKTEAEIKGLNMKLQDNQRQQQEVQQQKQASAGYAQEAAGIARSLAQDPNLSQVTGSLAARTPVVRNSSQDVLNQASRLQSLLTQDNLKLMTGVLTDRDITFLGNIASGLQITENGIKGSEPAVRKRLSDIAGKLESKIQAQGGVQIPQSSYQQPAINQQPAQTTQQSAPAAGGGYSSLWGD